MCSHFVDCKLVTGEIADKAERSYKEFIKSDDIKEKMVNFEERLDLLYIPLLKNHQELLLMVKLVLILSHGNARVESGFSINDDLLVENMKEESMIATRLVLEGVIKDGGLQNVVVTRKMMEEVDKARKRYHTNLELQREQQTAYERRKQEKRKLSAEVTAVKAAKARLTEEMKTKASELESQIFHLEQELRKK